MSVCLFSNTECCNSEVRALTLEVKSNDLGNLPCINHRHLIHFFHFALFFSFEAYLSFPLQILCENGAKLILSENKCVL